MSLSGIPGSGPGAPPRKIFAASDTVRRPALTSSRRASFTTLDSALSALQAEGSSSSAQSPAKTTVDSISPVDNINNNAVNSFFMVIMSLS